MTKTRQGLLAIAVLCLVRVMACSKTTPAHAKRPAQLAPPFVQVNFRSIKNTATGQVSVPICGTDGRGIFFNSGDSGGGSCIDPTLEIVVQGEFVWVPLNNSSSFFETACFSGWWACVVATNPVPRPESGCAGALQWQAFRVSDLEYSGQAATVGGVLTFPAPHTYTCIPPTPRPPATATPTPSGPPQTPAATATPAPPPGPSPTPECAGEIKQLSDGSCYCVATNVRVRCPGGPPPPTAIPPTAPPATATAVPPAATATAIPATAIPATPTPPATPTITPTRQPTPVTTIPGGGTPGGCGHRGGSTAAGVSVIGFVWIQKRRRRRSEN